ncbi:MAG TPA: hydroxysqualene dehydroxylase HpnE [Vicinamibacterales bacterium]|nr:hydroxysqualene dehydroxylase HpnE [Vicinamibacterales bacterium]
MPRASVASRGDDAIVIGGGFAGLAAATLLAEQGARVLVLEARPALGGRATAFTDPATGERVDNGQHVLLGCYRDTFRFLDRIGAAGHVQVQDRLTVDMIDRDGRASRLSCPSLPPPLNLVAGLFTWSAVGWKDRIGSLHVGRALRARRASLKGSPHDETVRDWLVRHHQTPRLVEMLWEPLALAALNQPIDVASAAPFARALSEMLGSSPRDASLALPLKPLDEMYALPARAYIEKHGGEVRTNSPAKIRGPEGSAPHCTIVVRGETIVAPTVICAVPWFALSEVFADPPSSLRATLDAADRTGASPIVTVNLWFDRIVTDQVLVGLPGRTMQWVFDKRRVFGEQASHLSLVSSGAGQIVSLTNEALIELATREVDDAIPAARGASVRRAVVVREKRATFSVAPGQPPRPGTRTPIPGLFLAGDWIDTGLPATIEGAVRSGHSAASLALS